MIGQEWKREAHAFVEAASADEGMLSSVGDNPYVADMERELEMFLKLPSPSAIAVCSATIGLKTVLLAIGVKKGDEVITGAFGWGQTVAPILELGAKPVFVDCEKDGVNIDLEQVEAVMTPRTKAVVAAELFGLPLDRNKLHALEDCYRIPVILDCAQSLGATAPGSLPTAVVYSFGRTKLISGGEGGAIVTGDRQIFDACLIASQHPIRVLQRLQSDVSSCLIDSVAPNGRIHPFAAMIIGCKLRTFSCAVAERRTQFQSCRQRLADSRHDPVPLPAGALQAPTVIPVIENEERAVGRFCEEVGWKTSHCSMTLLTDTATVRSGRLLPRANAAWGRRELAEDRISGKRFPNAERCRSHLTLISPLDTAPAGGLSA